MTRPRLHLLWLASLGAALVACPEPPAAGPPCEDDVTNCSDDTSKFVEDPTCGLDGDLELVLGEGFEEFAVVPEGVAPELYTGFQGGQHVFLGVRVINADLDRPLLKVRVKMDYCETDCEDPLQWRTDVVREVVADSAALTTTDEGWYEFHSMLIQVFNWRFAANQRIEMLVTDPCGRQGVIVHDSMG